MNLKSLSFLFLALTLTTIKAADSFIPNPSGPPPLPGQFVSGPLRTRVITETNIVAHPTLEGGGTNVLLLTNITQRTVVEVKPMKKKVSTFKLTCQECRATWGNQIPISVQTNGCRTIPQAMVIERSLTFVCPGCQDTLAVRNEKVVPTPIVVEEE